MADCSKNFSTGKDSFLSKIILGKSKEDQLRTSRDALRTKIRNFLKEKKVKDIRFYRQGSYAHHTIINPLDGDYDIDDGVYMDLTEIQNEPSTQTIHNWIKEAAKGHTQQDPQDKEACIRAKFKQGYHVDLPAYKVERDDDNDDETYYLAKKQAGWEESNPRAMTDWFQEQTKANSEQLHRLVKYFKAWKDFRTLKTKTKLPSGLTLTILTCQEFQSDIRDDISFYETAKKILSRLEDDDAIWKPYEPTENMRDYLSDTQFDHFLDELERLIDKGGKAIDEEDAEKAAKQWQKVLGDRFPIIETPKGGGSEKAKSFATPTILGSTVRSA